MHITDPVADMLTRIRNANNAKHETVDVPASNMKKSIAQILLDEGYIKAYPVCAVCPSPVCVCMWVPMSCPVCCVVLVLRSYPPLRAS